MKRFLSLARLTLLISLVGLTLLPVTALTAQEVPPDPALVRAATRTLQSDLRNFSTVQERYYADHSTYASSLHALREMYRPSSGVTLVVLTASARGHSEIAIDERVPGLVCAIYFGSAPPPLGSGEAAEVECQGP